MSLEQEGGEGDIDSPPLIMEQEAESFEPFR